jgi:ribosomal protein S18 acetylase RimI-like enzyme
MHQVIVKPTPQVALRPTRPEDAQAIINHLIAIASEPDVYVSYSAEEANVPVEKEAERIRKDMEVGNLCLVAESESLVVGEFCCRRDHAFAFTRHTAVLGMSVKSGYRNQGIGTRFMEGAIHWAAEHDVVRLELEVYADNAPAIHLYKKFGFEVEGLKKKYAYQRGRYYDSLIMARLCS